MEETPEKITYESLWKAIIRPPRDYYSEEDLGSFMFNFNGREYIRKDFEIIDFRGKLLKGSFIEPDKKDRPFDVMPCVIYLHSNSSSLVEGINMKEYLLKNDINLCVFDFEGSGYSEGEYISLGYYEKNQVKDIVDFVEQYPGVGEIGLWGRSMGATTALIYASMDKRIKAIVVDSPFSDFRKLAKETCLSFLHIPSFLIEGAISVVGKSVYKKNKMKINDIKAINAVEKCYAPAMFIHAIDDDMVKFQHSIDLFNNYAGNVKQLKDVVGGHNGKRNTILLEYVGRFFSKYLTGDYEFDIPIEKTNTNKEFNFCINKNTQLEKYNLGSNLKSKICIYKNIIFGKYSFDKGNLLKENIEEEKNSFEIKNNKGKLIKKSKKNQEENKNKTIYKKKESNIRITTLLKLDFNINKNINIKEEQCSKSDFSTNPNTIFNLSGHVNEDLNLNKF